MIKKSKLSRRIRILFISLLSIVIFLYNIAYLIVNYQPLENADVVFILMGGGEERIRFADSLYKQGYAKKIIMINPVSKDDRSVNKSGILIQTIPFLLKESLIDKGVNCRDILILDGPSKNTRGEAKIITEYCKNNPAIEKILISTSNYHSGRAYNMISSEINSNGLKTDVIIPFNHYSNYSSDKWFFSKEGLSHTLSESFKWIYYLLIAK